MVEITSAAASHLLRVRRERSIDAGQSARLVQSADRIALTFTPSPDPGDQRLETDGFPLFLASDIATRLEGSVIDTRTDGGKEVLIVRAAPGAPAP